MKKKSTEVLESGSTVCDLGDMMYSSSSTIRPGGDRSVQLKQKNERKKEKENEILLFTINFFMMYEILVNRVIYEQLGSHSDIGRIGRQEVISKCRSNKFRTQFTSDCSKKWSKSRANKRQK